MNRAITGNGSPESAARKTTLVALASIAFLLSVMAAVPRSRAQSFTGGFNFTLPPRDTATVEFLPAFPRRAIGPADFVGVGTDGHFAVNGSPIRFFGGNVVADAAFPLKDNVWFIAGRMRKMGLNLVRFHHMDNPWGSGSLFVHGSDTRHLNLVTLDRLEYFVAALKSEGIYANVNLHVSRGFCAADGVAGADSIQEMGKGVTLFDPQLIALQKEFATQLLTHTNPYTGLSLARDPVMAMVEITNENSLYRMWRDGMLKPFSSGGVLMVRHSAMLDSLWNQFLISRYGTTAALAAAWDTGSTQSEGPNQIQNSTFDLAAPAPPWVLELHTPATGTMTRDLFYPYAGPYSARVDVTQSDGTDWHVQWKHTGLTMVKDSVYIIEFAARSDVARSISVTVMLEGSPWTSYGGIRADLETAWKTFSFTLRAPTTVSGGLRLSFTVGAAAGTYWFDNIRFATVGAKGLEAGETLEARSVRRLDYAECARYTDQRVRDMTAFHIDVQNRYYDEMVLHLKNDIGVRVPIVGTNWNIGLPDLAVQTRLDYVDNHSYWDHPWFPSVPWSSTDWLINNNPMVQSSSGGTIPWLTAGVAAKGKPYTISEYNHAFPNRYQTEGVVMLSAYASFHDVDGIMFFDYNDGVDWEADKVPGYFALHRNSAMMSLMPSCALAYRSSYVTPAPAALEVRYAADDILLFPKLDNGSWPGPQLFPTTLALRYSLKSDGIPNPAGSNIATLPPAPTPPYVTETGQITWNPSGLFAVSAERFVVAAGFLPQFVGRRIGDLIVISASDFASLTWTSLSGEALRRADRSLITLSTRVQNTGMIWDGTQTVHDQWGGPPTQVQPAIVTLKLSVAADSLHIFPLSGTGVPASAGWTVLPIDTNTFIVALDQTTMRTVWFGVERLGWGTTSAGDGQEERLPSRSHLLPNFPNPFNPSTTIPFEVGSDGWVSLTVYDLLGREVDRPIDSRMPAGFYETSWDARGAASGVYVARLSVQTDRGSQATDVRRMVLMK